MAAGDINDALSQIPGVAIADDAVDPSDLGAGYALLKFKNGTLVWLPAGGAVCSALALGKVSQLAGLTAEASPADADLFLMERASDGALRKVQAQNLPGGGGGGGWTECVKLYNSATQTFTFDVVSNVLFDSESYDTDTMHNTGSNTDRITFTTAGKYHVGFHFVLPTQDRLRYGYVFPATSPAQTLPSVMFRIAAGVNEVVQIHGAFELEVSAGDYLTFGLANYCPDQAVVTLGAGAGLTVAWAHRVA